VGTESSIRFSGSTVLGKTVLYYQQNGRSPRREKLALVDYSGAAGKVSDPKALVGVLAAIPAFNEQKTIGSIVLTARRYANKVIVVDDGSDDQTAWIAEQAGATVIHHPENRGYGAALRSCFDYARNNDFGVLVILDGDGQHRPELIPKVAAPVREGRADVSIGSRFLSGQESQGLPGYRRFGIGIITRLTNLGTRHNGTVTDAQSGFRAYSRAAIRAINPSESTMGASAEILWEAEKRGLRVLEVPVEIDYEGRAKRNPIRHGLELLGAMIRYIETEHALLFFGVPGLVLFVAGVGLGLTVIDTFGRTRELALGTALVTLGLTVTGLLLAFTGLILHAVINASKRIR
jgi:hypothetical protein